MNAKLSITEAKPKHYRIYDTSTPLRVCAYCRVSTDKSDQRNSYRAQKQFFESEFRQHPNWIDCKVFADEGISGTSLKKREQFNLMIALAKQGGYDLIITKEVSRFSRNIQDLLNIVEDLSRQKVFIWFMAEEINTEQIDCRERLIETGKQAEAESLKTSKRVRWGHRRQMVNGVVFGRRDMYGYHITRDDNDQQHFEIIEDEAKVVQQIFRMYAAGYGTFKIARKLESEGIPTKQSGKEWSNVVILRILRNEKYVGDLENGKTYTPNALTHDKKYNHGESASYYITNHHPDSAIIDRPLWNAVQSLLKQNTLSEEQKQKHSNRYWCSGKVFCGECGERFVSHTKHLKCGEIYKSWKCWNGQQHGRKKTISLENGETREVGCTSQSINDVTLRQGAYDLICELIKPNLKQICDSLEKSFQQAQAIPKKQYERDLKKLERQAGTINQTLVNLTVKYSNGDVPKDLYLQAQEQQQAELQKVQEKIHELTQSDQGLFFLTAQHEQKMFVLRSLSALKDDAFNEDLFRRLIDKIVVYNGHILEYYFYAIPEPIRMAYTTHGRLENFTVEFTISGKDGTPI